MKNPYQPHSTMYPGGLPSGSVFWGGYLLKKMLSTGMYHDCSNNCNPGAPLISSKSIACKNERHNHCLRNFKNLNIIAETTIAENIITATNIKIVFDIWALFTL